MREVGLRPLLAASGLALACAIAAPTDRALAAGPDPDGTAFAPDVPARVDVSRSPEATGAGTLSRGRLRNKLGGLSRQAGSGTGVWVAELGGDGTLFSSRSGRARILASNEKLFTTATALDRLGAKSRIETAVYAKGAIKGSTLRGPLFLVGGGDPALGNGGVRALARQVRGAGIRRVEGGIRADDSVFDRRRGVPDSNWGYSPYIGALLSGLSFKGAGRRGDPAKAAAAALRKWLRRSGVGVKAGVHRGTAPRSVLRRDAVAKHNSATIASLIAATNKPSNNFYAEMLLKRIWAKPGRRGTTKGGAKAVRRFARRWGAKVRAVDGSGLTRGNRASPQSVGHLLSAMQRHDDDGAFYDSLPVAGQEGTLDGRMEGTRAAGRCRAKTGTLTGVSALSGYCNTNGGRVAFSILMNGIDVNRAHVLQDRMAVAIARYRG